MSEMYDTWPHPQHIRSFRSAHPLCMSWLDIAGVAHAAPQTAVRGQGGTVQDLFELHGNCFAIFRPYWVISVGTHPRAGARSRLHAETSDRFINENNGKLPTEREREKEKRPHSCHSKL